MSSEQIDHEITQLATQLKTLRLPHKLNQYHVYEKKLLSLKKLAKGATADGKSNQYEAQIDQLQAQLDNSILCGVSQCFICQSQSALPASQAPTYNRFVSAELAYQRTTKQISQNNPTLPKYGQQLSYHDQQTKNSASDECQPVQPDIVPSLLPKQISQQAIPPVKDEFASKNSTAECKKAADIPESNTGNKNTMVTNDRLENQLSQPVKSPSPIQDIPDQSPPPSNIVTPLISSANGNIERETKPLAPPSSAGVAYSKPPILSPAPFRSSPSSYRAYKDFINNYSTDRNKMSQVEESKKAA